MPFLSRGFVYSVRHGYNYENDVDAGGHSTFVRGYHHCRIPFFKEHAGSQIFARLDVDRYGCIPYADSSGSEHRLPGYRADIDGDHVPCMGCRGYYLCGDNRRKAPQKRGVRIGYGF